MAEANRDESEKCKRIAQGALAAGDAEKATRFLQKAKRMCPSDTSIDELLAQVASGGATGAKSGPGFANNGSGDGPRFRPTPASGTARPSASGSTGGTRTNKEGASYTTEQMQLVQRILRTRDYYDILEVPKESNEDTIKRAYKKLALKLHPDKNKAPGAEEAFKKLSKAMQCLSDADKKHVYDRYGDEERIPQQHRQQYQQDFMTPEDLFAAFFGGGATFHTFHGGQHQRHHSSHHADDDGNPMQMHRAQLIQALPVLLLVLLTLASNFASRDGGSRFSFSPSPQYNNQRSTAALDVSYYVTDDFEQHYGEGTRVLADFEKQVEVYYVRNLHSECDYQEKMMYKKVMIAKRKNSQEEMKAARNTPRPACKELEQIKKKHSGIYRSAMYMGAY